MNTFFYEHTHGFKSHPLHQQSAENIWSGVCYAGVRVGGGVGGGTLAFLKFKLGGSEKNGEKRRKAEKSGEKRRKAGEVLLIQRQVGKCGGYAEAG